MALSVHDEKVEFGIDVIRWRRPLHGGLEEFERHFGASQRMRFGKGFGSAPKRDFVEIYQLKVLRFREYERGLDAVRRRIGILPTLGIALRDGCAIAAVAKHFLKTGIEEFREIDWVDEWH